MLHWSEEAARASMRHRNSHSAHRTSATTSCSLRVRHVLSEFLLICYLSTNALGNDVDTGEVQAEAQFGVLDEIYLRTCSETVKRALCAIHLRPCSPSGLAQPLCREQCEDLLCEGCPGSVCAADVCAGFPVCNVNRTCTPTPPPPPPPRPTPTTRSPTSTPTSTNSPFPTPSFDEETSGASAVDTPSPMTLTCHLTVFVILLIIAYELNAHEVPSLF